MAMNFKSTRWKPLAIGLSIINLIAVGFAAASAEAWHAGAHAALALAFGLWAQRLRQGVGADEYQLRLNALDGELGVLRLELLETQERLDFTERILAQVRDSERLGPQPREPE